MSLEEFWHSSPRITSLFIEGYRRRRAWAAFHAGFGTAGKRFDDVTVDDLLGKGRKPAAEPMTEDQMVQNIRRWRIATGSRSTERTQPDVE